MGYVVERFQAKDAVAWDEYVKQHNAGNYCHLSGWQTVIDRAYGRSTHFWMCCEAEGRIAGLLPTVHLKHPLFGNSLVSMPYLDGGGILADNPEVCRELLASTKESAASSNIPFIELRHSPAKSYPCEGQTQELPTDKVQMIISLPDDPDLLFKGFQNKNKVRTIVRKAVKLGLRLVLGGEELLQDFYQIFAMNQRELGTPVHSRRFFARIQEVFKDYCQIGVVYMDSVPIAAGIIFCFKDRVSFPWGGSLKSHHNLNPFPFLVWELLKFSCEGGYKLFDFGRSSLDSGPYKFKSRWGAQPYPLHWQQVRLNPGMTIMESRSKFSLFTKIWRKLPLPVTIWFGPALRKFISL
jgi:serine/alanine adding enzyme